MNRNDYFEADMALVSNDYERAQKYFEKLVKSNPDNASLNFLNGLCLINLPGRKKEALKYLQIAVPKASADYKYGDPDEENAPLEALKYCAIAYRLHNEIPKAIDLLNQYRSMLKPKEKTEIAMTNSLIDACNTTLRLEGNPIYFRKNSLDGNLTSEELKMYPVVNNDETMLFYAIKGQYGKDDIYFSQKSEGVWGNPVKITALLGARSECYPSSVSFDNERLYLTIKDLEGTDIYCSHYKNNKWQRMVKLDKPVNGRDWDSQASESPDGKYLYFSSDRKGGVGNMDLYKTEKDENGVWKKAINLGATINTTENELMPILSTDQTKLFFKSDAHENVGGYDIFVSDKINDNEWGQPRNIGYPINTTGDDIHIMPVRNGDFAYIAFENPNDNSKNNIDLVEIFSDSHPRKFNISGMVILPENDNIGQTALEVINSKSYDKIYETQVDNQIGNYIFELTGGSYMISFEKPGYKPYTQFIDLPVNYPDNALIVNAVLEKEAPVAEVIPEPVVEERVQDVSLSVEPEEDIIVVEPKIKQVTETVVEEPAAQEPVYVEEKIEPAPFIAEGKPDYSTYPTYEGKYTIQFMASYKNVALSTLDGTHQVEIQRGNDGYYRYITGVFNNMEEADQLCNEIKRSRYKSAFIREYNLDDYLNDAAQGSAPAYTIQLMAVQKETDITTLKGVSNIKISYGDDQWYRYTTGEFSSLSSAQQELKIIIGKGYKNAYIKKIADIPNYH